MNLPEFRVVASFAMRLCEQSADHVNHHQQVKSEAMNTTASTCICLSLFPRDFKKKRAVRHSDRIGVRALDITWYACMQCFRHHHMPPSKCALLFIPPSVGRKRNAIASYFYWRSNRQRLAKESAPHSRPSYNAPDTVASPSGPWVCGAGPSPVSWLLGTASWFGLGFSSITSSRPTFLRIAMYFIRQRHRAYAKLTAMMNSAPHVRAKATRVPMPTWSVSVARGFGDSCKPLIGL